MQDPDLTLLIKAAREAGEIATGYFNGSAKVWDKPDNSPVTEADLAVDAHLGNALRGARPDYGWLSEETEDTADRLACKKVFIVDPIDGTRSFTEGSKTWAHALAVVENGQTTAGVIYLPMRDQLFVAAKGQGAFLNGTRLSASTRSNITGAEVLAARPAMQERFWQGAVPDLKRSYRPSLAYRMALVAQGRFDALMTFRPSWEWDIAAGDLILREAGASSTDKTGRGLVFNKADPRCDGLLGGGKVVHGEILTQLAFPTDAS